MLLWRQIPINVDRGGAARCIQTSYARIAPANLLYHTDGRAMTGVKEEMIKVVGKVDLEGKLELWKQVYSAEGDAPCVTSALGGGGNSIKIEEKDMIKRAGNIDQPTWQEHHRRVYDSEGDSPTLFADYNGEKCIKVLEDDEMIKRAGRIDDPKWREHWQRVYESDGDAPSILATNGGDEERCTKLLEDGDGLNLFRSKEFGGDLVYKQKSPTIKAERMDSGVCLAEPQAMRLVRTEECKAKRRETHDVGMSFKEGKYAEPRGDGMLGTLTTVEKDNYIAEPFTVASRGRGENNEQHLEVGSSEHTNALTTVEKDNYVAELRVYDAYNHREIDSDKVGTLTSASFHGSGNTGTFYVQPTYRIRKLTEKECFRLMGVKDEDSERVHKNQSKSSMYHLAGDSIVTACLMGLFGEMFDMDWQSKVKELQESISYESKHPSEIQ